MTREQIKYMKKEKKLRREWNKYKDKLVAERVILAEHFKSGYGWDSTQFANSSKSPINSPKETTMTSNMYLEDPKHAQTLRIGETFEEENGEPVKKASLAPD